VPAETILAAGTHRLLVTRDDYDPAQTAVVLQSGERKEVTLDPIAPGVTRKWWFWTLVGTGVVVVAGGVVAAVVAATTEGSPSTGTIPPGQVTFP
jgi:hypothetical protein